MQVASDSEASHGRRMPKALLGCCAAVLLCAIPTLSSDCAAADLPAPLEEIENREAGRLLPHFVAMAAGMRAVGPAWFRRHGIELLKGREFNEGDRRETPGVVIINEVLASSLWPDEDAVGKYMLVGLDSPVLCMVVGVVANSRAAKCEGAPEAEIYIPCLQLPAAPLRLLA